jgi:hypothetical protein
MPENQHIRTVDFSFPMSSGKFELVAGLKQEVNN